MSKQGADTFIILSPGFAASEADTNCLPMQQAFVSCLKESYPTLHIIIIAFQYPYSKMNYQWNGVTVMSFAGKNKGGISNLLLRRRVYSALSEINSRYNITGILSFWYGECALAGKRFADKNKLPHFCWLLGQDARKGNKYAEQVKLKAGEMIALSDFLQDEFERNYSVKPAWVVPSGFDVKQLLPVQPERDIDLLAAGSLIALKQFEIFVAVVAGIKKQQPAIKALLVGAGPEKKKLQALIETNGLSQNITLTGEWPHGELLQLMQRTKVFLHPSSYEGFSGVCQEALACGVHVISFCRAMNQDIEQWYIVRDEQQMVEKTLSLLQQQTYKPVVPYAMTDVVRQMMGLFSS